MSTDGILEYQGTKRVLYRGDTSNIVFDTRTTSLGIGVTGSNNPSSNLYITGNAYVSSNLAIGGVMTMGVVNVAARHNLQAVTDMGNVTTHTVEFTNPTTAFTTTGNVSDLNIVSNVNMLHTANTASIKLNSNVVTEFPRSKKLIKYPRVALTANSSGGYVASANSEYHNDYAAFRAFNNKGPGYAYGATIGWEPANISTFSSSGTWVGSTDSSANTTMTLDDGNTIYGEWLQIQLPTKIQLEYVNFLPLKNTSHAMAHRAPRAGYILGSNNGTNWTALKNWSGIHYETWVAHYDKFYEFDINREVDYYQYFRFVWTETASDSGNSLSEYASCQELEFWGVPEYDPETHGTDVVVKSVPNVPNTDWLEVYFDAKGLGNGSTTVNDLKPVGTANNGTVGGNTSVTNEAFTFDGTGDYITSTVTTGTGNQSFSVACWFKFTTLGGLLWGFTGTTNGTSGSNPTNNSTPHAYFNTTGSISFDFWANSTVTAEKLIEVNRWYAGVWTYDGTTRKIYIDGTRVHLPQSSTPLSIIDNTSRLSIGIYPTNLSGGPMTGSVANFRLFNRALTTDEIYQLYDYQKEYFGHSTNNMTLKAGRLGIGTSEPRAVLDVRGGGRFKHMNDSGDSDLLDVHGAIRVTGENPDYLRIRLGNYFSVGEATGVAVPETLTPGRVLTDHPRSGSAIIEYTGGESYTRNEGAHIWLNGDTIGIMNTGDVGTLHWYDSDYPSDHTTSGRHWHISTSGGFTNASDLTLKNNIRYFDDEYNTSESMLKYSKIKFCKYNWKKELKDPSGVKEDFYGVIAQEIEPLFPEMIQADAAGLKMIKQERLQYISYHMIANLIQKNADLEARISALENA